MSESKRSPAASKKARPARPRKPAPSGLERRLEALRTILAGMGKVVVAYSGGVDSSLLLKVAADVLGSGVYAVIASSPTYPGREIRGARALARSLKVRHEVIATSEMDNPAFTANPPLRCYHCKRELMTEIRRIADRKGIAVVVDGQNADDLGDYRPGARAAAEMGVRSPLREAGLSKADIRALSRRYGLRLGTSRPWPAWLRGFPTIRPSRRRPWSASSGPRRSCARWDSDSSASGIMTRSPASKSFRTKSPAWSVRRCGKRSSPPSVKRGTPM